MTHVKVPLPLITLGSFVVPAGQAQVSLPVARVAGEDPVAPLLGQGAIHLFEPLTVEKL